MKKAFTLIELMIVIGILGVLMGVILSQFGGATESSRAAVCQSHMRNLAQACQTYAMSNNYYPRAGTQEFVDYDSSSDSTVYGIRTGWIARLGDKDNLSRVDTGRKSGTYRNSLTMSEDEILESITNGCLYATLRDRASYTCPLEKGAGWSYAMNSRFGFTPPGESDAIGSRHAGQVYYGSLSRADRVLLFAEIDRSQTEDAANDPILDYNNDENLGFNHKNGKLTVAHVVFADCHTARLARPRDAAQDKLRDLTEWLCQGYDVTYVGGQYEKVEDSATEDLQ